jgi:hypothetical protein
MIDESVKLTAYIAGPMRGIKYYNYHAFLEAENFLKMHNINPINPHTLDFEKNNFTPLSLPENSDWNNIPSCLNIKDIIKADIEAVLRADFIYALRGWRKSRGACAEIGVALWASIEIIEDIEDFISRVDNIKKQR